MTAARKLSEEYLRQAPPGEPALRPSQNRKAKRFRLPITLKICFLAAVCVAVSLLYLKLQVISFDLNMQLVQLQEEVNILEQRNDYLRLSLEKQRSLQQVEQIARTQLGMVDPHQTASLIVAPHSPSPPFHGHSAEKNLPIFGEGGIFAALANWLNKAFPIGGVEAGTLQR